MNSNVLETLKTGNRFVNNSSTNYKGATTERAFVLSTARYKDDPSDSDYPFPVYAFSTKETVDNTTVRKLYWFSEENNPLVVAYGNNYEGVFGNYNGYRNLKRADIADWNMSEVTSLYRFFQLASSLTTIAHNSTEADGTFAIGEWDVSSVTNMQYLFYRRTDNPDSYPNVILPAGIDFSNWNLSNCTNFTEMFYNQTNYRNTDIVFADGTYRCNNSGTLTKISN